MRLGVPAPENSASAVWTFATTQPRPSGLPPPSDADIFRRALRMQLLLLIYTLKTADGAPLVSC